MPRTRRAPPPADITPRIDAAFAAVLPLLVNSMTGAGSASDPAGAWAVQVGAEQQPDALIRLANSEPGNTICAEVPLWLWKAGIRLSVDGDPQPALTYWEGLAAPQAFAQAHDLARALGGAGIIVDTGQDFSTPFRAEAVRHVRLIVVDGYTLRCEPVILDPRSPYHGQPEWYQMDAPGYLSTAIHASHVLPFIGVTRRVPRLTVGAWHNWPGVSVLQACWGALSQWFDACSANQAAGRRMATFLIEHPEFMAKMAQEPENFKAILDTITQRLGTGGILHSPPGGKVGSASLSLGGLQFTNAFAKERLSQETRIPAALLFSQPPTGLSTDEKSWWAGWTARLAGEFGGASFGCQAANYQRLYTMTAPIIYGAPPPAWQGIEPGDFRAPSDQERADLFQREANAAKTLIDAQAIPPRAVRVSEGRVEVLPESEWPEAPKAPQIAPQPQDGPSVAPVADAAPSRESTLIALAQDPEPLAAVLRRVRALLPDLTVEEWPHVTLLYLGDVPSRSMPAVERAAVEHADEWPESLIPVEIGPLGDPGDDGQAIVLFLRSAGLQAPQNRLMRALAPEIRARQFPAFRPHITLGYVRDLTDEQAAALSSIEVPASLPAGALVLRRGDADRIRIDAEESWAPPKGAQEAARRALEVRAEKPPSERGMTDVGLARARDLANGRAQSRETIRRMKAYFDRHQSDREGSTWADQGKGWQAWMGWGGDVGWRWATRLIERWDREE